MLTLRVDEIPQKISNIVTAITSGDRVLIQDSKSKMFVLSEAEIIELDKAKRNLEYLSMLNQSLEEARNGEVFERIDGKFVKVPERVSL